MESYKFSIPGEPRTLPSMAKRKSYPGIFFSCSFFFIFNSFFFAMHFSSYSKIWSMNNEEMINCTEQTLVGGMVGSGVYGCTNLPWLQMNCNLVDIFYTISAQYLRGGKNLSPTRPQPPSSPSVNLALCSYMRVCAIFSKGAILVYRIRQSGIAYIAFNAVGL